MLEALGITLPGLIFTIINFLIIVLILVKFLYKPFLGALENRRETIRASYEKAEAAEHDAQAKYDEYVKLLENADEEGQEIVKKAKGRADDQAQLIIRKAEEEAAQIRDKARKDIEREKEMALAEMREQISQLAILAAEQILEKEVSAEGHEQVINNVLAKAGESKWQN